MNCNGDAHLIGRNSLDALIATTPHDLVRFWSWFGQSRIFDLAGRPLVVYHGSASMFDQFDACMLTDVLRTNRLDHFFTPEPVKAQRYAGYKGGAIVRSFYLPLPDAINVEFERMQRTVGNARAFRALARDVGTCGAVVIRDGAISEVIAPLPTQIKSTNNCGSWSPADPRFEK